MVAESLKDLQQMKEHSSFKRMDESSFQGEHTDVSESGLFI